jgi:dynein heavy chain
MHIFFLHLFLDQSCHQSTCRLIVISRDYSLPTQAWPKDALQLVASKFLRDVELEPKERESVVTICQYFHDSARLLSNKFLENLGRYNYVTPTSYLELVKSFKALLQKKRNEIMKIRNQYVVGLEKLQFASSQVCVFDNCQLFSLSS